MTLSEESSDVERRHNSNSLESNRRRHKTLTLNDNLVLPPKKTYVVECMRVPPHDSKDDAAVSHDALSSSDQDSSSGAKAMLSDQDCDMPINLSIKTEPCQQSETSSTSERPPKNNNISSIYNKTISSSSNRSAFGRSDSYEFSSSSQEIVYSAVPGYVIPGTEPPLPVAQYGFSSSQESTHSASSQPTSGSSQESSQTALAFAMYDDDDITNTDFRHMVKSFENILKCFKPHFQCFKLILCNFPIYIAMCLYMYVLCNHFAEVIDKTPDLLLMPFVLSFSTDQ